MDGIHALCSSLVKQQPLSSLRQSHHCLPVMVACQAFLAHGALSLHSCLQSLLPQVWLDSHAWDPLLAPVLTPGPGQSRSFGAWLLLSQSLPHWFMPQYGQVDLSWQLHGWRLLGAPSSSNNHFGCSHVMLNQVCHAHAAGGEGIGPGPNPKQHVPEVPSPERSHHTRTLDFSLE